MHQSPSKSNVRQKNISLGTNQIYTKHNTKSLCSLTPHPFKWEKIVSFVALASFMVF